MRILLLILFLIPMAAHASLTIGTAGSYSKPYGSNLSTSLVFSAKYAIPGAALLYGLPFGDKNSELEAGLLYLPRSFSDGYNDLTMTNLELDLLYRYWLSETHLIGIEVGGYYAYGLNIKQNLNTISFSDYGINNSDMGGFLGAAINIKISDRGSIFIDNRVGFSAVSVATNTQQNLWFLNIVSIIGYRFMEY